MDIELKDLRPRFIEQEVISASEIYGEQMRFHEGSRYLVRAPSGKGKSTLLNAVYGTVKDYNGEIRGNENAKQEIAYVPQGLRLFHDLSAMDNLRLKNELSGHLTEERMRSLLDKVGLAEFKERSVGTLSFGQRQRVSITRALCMPFDWLLLDEPFSHLDENMADQVCAVIDQELRLQNAGLIIAMLDESEHFEYDARYSL